MIKDAENLKSSPAFYSDFVFALAESLQEVYIMIESHMGSKI